MTPWITPSEIQTYLGPDCDTATAGSLSLAASTAVMNHIERDLSLQVLTEYHDSLGTEYILLDVWPIQSIQQVILNGNTSQPVVAAAYQQRGYKVDTYNTRKLTFPGYGRIPRGVLNVEVSYTAGYDLTQPAGSASGLPADVNVALKLTAAAMWNAAAADPNLASEQTAGVFSASFYPTGVGAVPPGAVSLLARYVRVAPNL